MIKILFLMMSLMVAGFLAGPIRGSMKQEDDLYDNPGSSRGVSPGIRTIETEDRQRGNNGNGNQSPGNGDPNQFIGNGDQSQFPGNGDPSQFLGNGDPSQFPGNGDPSQFLGNGDPSQFLGSGDPSQFLGNGDPSQFLGNGDPSQFLGNGDPSQFLGNGDPSQFLGNGDPSQFLGNGDPSQFLGNGDPSQVLWNEDPSQFPGNRNPNEFSGHPEQYMGDGNPASHMIRGLIPGMPIFPPNQGSAPGLMDEYDWKMMTNQCPMVDCMMMDMLLPCDYSDRVPSYFSLNGHRCRGCMQCAPQPPREHVTTTSDSPVTTSETESILDATTVPSLESSIKPEVTTGQTTNTPLDGVKLARSVVNTSPEVEPNMTSTYLRITGAVDVNVTDNLETTSETQ